MLVEAVVQAVTGGSEGITRPHHVWRTTSFRALARISSLEGASHVCWNKRQSGFAGRTPYSRGPIVPGLVPTVPGYRITVFASRRSAFFENQDRLLILELLSLSVIVLHLQSQLPVIVSFVLSADSKQVKHDNLEKSARGP